MKIFILSFALLPTLLYCAAPEQEKPTLEQLESSRQVHIGFTVYRDDLTTPEDKETWRNVVIAVNNLIDVCQEWSDDNNDLLFQEVYNAIEFLRDQKKANPSPAFHGLLSVSVGERSETINQSQTNNLVWLGCGTTGYNPERDSITEIAVIITDSELNILAQSPLFSLKNNSASEVEAQLLSFIKTYTNEYTHELPFLCGPDRIMKIRALLKKQMPGLEAAFSSVTINNFSTREFCILWNLEVFARKTPYNAWHAAYEALAEAAFYKKKYFKQETTLS
jgi:oligoribonuclease